MKKKYRLNDLDKLNIDLSWKNIIFLRWDLASGKTTMSKYMINNLLWIKEDVISPTYTYYNKYGENIYHFDLYRLNNYDEFFAIWWEDILDNPNNICIIEWPELIEKYYKSDLDISLTKTEIDDEREIEIK